MNDNLQFYPNFSIEDCSNCFEDDGVLANEMDKLMGEHESTETNKSEVDKFIVENKNNNTVKKN